MQSNNKLDCFETLFKLLRTTETHAFLHHFINGILTYKLNCDDTFSYDPMWGVIVTLLKEACRLWITHHICNDVVVPAISMAILDC